MLVLKDNVIDSETVCGNSHLNSASPEDWFWNPLYSEFGCVRLYSSIPKVYYVIDTWRILGPHPWYEIQCTQPSLTGHCPSRRRSVGESIRMQKRIQRTGVTVALNGSWICGQWCRVRNGQLQVNCVKVHDDGCLGVGSVSHLVAGLCETLYNSIKKGVIEYTIWRDWNVCNILY